MIKKCESCYSCGMPFQTPEDRSLGLGGSEYCKYCTDEKGRLKSYEEILQLLADYLVHSQALNPSAAINMAKEMMSEMPAWRNHKSGS